MRVEEILELLRNVENPFTNIDIVSEGLVSRVDVDDEEKRVTIYLAFARNTPAHPFAMAVNWPVQARIVKDIVRVLGDKVSYLEVLDDTTLQRYYPLDEDMEV